jgi:ribonuclease P protein subunit RPR2
VKGSLKPTSVKQIAMQRIEVLFKQADEVCRVNPCLAAKYVHSARKVAMSARMCLPAEFRRRACKNCNALLVQGVNCRVRIQQKREPHVVVTCLNCGNQSRILLRKKKDRVTIEQNNNTNETSRASRTER